MPIAPAPCDVVITPATSGIKALLNNPAYRVICAQPGDYRADGRIDITLSGASGSPRVLRFALEDGVRNAAQRTQRAIFENFYIRANWWVIQGITFQPLQAQNNWFLVLYGGDHNVLDGNLIDGIDQPNLVGNSGVVVGAFNGDPAMHNSVQGNVIRNGDQANVASDYFGVLIAAGTVATATNDHNRILDNEIYDWGDGVGIGGYTSDCTEPGKQHGTIIDGNDIYITGAKRIDCTTGAPDPDGECACAENGIDVKSNPGADPELWTRITNNRVWGYRPNSVTGSCGGSGANGQAVTAGNTCAGHVFVARNVVSDSTIGISVAGPSWIVTGNLMHDIRASNGRTYQTQALSPGASASNLQIQFNTVVGSDNAYDDQSTMTNTRCNVVVDDEALSGSAGFRGANHSTEYNFLYHAPQPNFQGSTNEFYTTPAESGDAPYCYWRRRWSAPEVVCVPFAATTPASTHYAAGAECDADLGAPFGMESISFVAAPEPGATGLGIASLAAAAALARRRTRG